MKSYRQFSESEEHVKMTPEKDTQYGSNPGGIHTDEHGQKHYVKFYKNHEQARSEVLAGKIYHHMGAHSVNPEFKHVNGKPAVVTKWNPDLKQMKPHEFEKLDKHQAHDVGRAYHAAILTKNWDAVGLEHDNLVKHKKTGKMHTVDTGGTFNFRAQGGHKDYGPDIAEHKSLRDNDQASGHVFSHVFKHHPEAESEGLKAVRGMDDKHIHHLFQTSGLKNHEELHRSFVERKKALLK
jgi:hypothetical protein